MKTALVVGAGIGGLAAVEHMETARMKEDTPAITSTLPAEGVRLLIAVDAIPDTFSTTLNVTGNPAATALVARRQSRQ